MTITWPTSETTICHGATRTVGEALGPDAFEADVRPGLRRRAYLEAPGVAYEHQGNDETIVAFRVRILCATAAAAAELAASIAADTARTGTLTAGELVLSDAGCTRLRPRAAGLACIVEYEFAGYATKAEDPPE